MSDVAYTAIVNIERVRGPIRTAKLPGRETPVTFGVHGAIAEHYGVDPEAFPPDTTTIDYVIAATGG